MAGKVEIDIGTHLGKHEGWAILRCVLHENDDIYAVLYFSNDDCPLCKYIRDKDEETKPLEEKIKILEDQLELAKLRLEKERTEHNTLRIEVSDYLALKHKVKGEVNERTQSGA